MAETNPFDIVELSLGAGVQSSVLGLMLTKGLLQPMPDVAIFADTQWEPKAVYEHLDWLEKQLVFPVVRVTNGSIRESVVGNFSHKNQRTNPDTPGNITVLPVFMSNGSITPRNCTDHYKINPIQQEIRRMLGVTPGERVKKGTRVLQMMGISIDEAGRMRDTRISWITNDYPLIDAGLSRADCRAWFEHFYPGRTLPRSACIGCPFHNNAEWYALKSQAPDEFEDACQVDDALRAGAPRMKPHPTGDNDGHQYLHSSGIPLRDVEFKPQSREKANLGLFSHNMMINECEGMCGV